MNIIGRVTRDAEVHTTPQDKKVVNFSVAAWTANNRELRSSLNFHISTIKLHGSNKKIEHAQVIVKQENTKIIIEEPVDDLPF